MNEATARLERYVARSNSRQLQQLLDAHLKEDAVTREYAQDLQTRWVKAEAENARLREALERIADIATPYQDMPHIARATLKETNDG